MMVRSLSGWIRKNSSYLAILGSIFLGIILCLYLYNKNSHTTLLNASREYIPSTISPVYPPNPTYIVEPNTSINFEWEVSSPVSRKLERTFVLYGSTSSPSATTYDANPDNLPYPNRTQDYILGGFALPYRFTSRVTFKDVGIVYYRFYARVEGQDIYSPEYSIKILR